MRPRIHRLAGWLLALAVVVGLATLGGAAAAEAARASVASGETQDDLRILASPGPPRCLPQSPGTATDPPIPVTATADRSWESSASISSPHHLVEPSFYRPTFLRQVSYWTTGPPPLG